MNTSTATSGGASTVTGFLVPPFTAQAAADPPGIEA
jgi:hypothetical protein